MDRLWKVVEEMRQGIDLKGKVLFCLKNVQSGAVVGDGRGPASPVTFHIHAGQDCGSVVDKGGRRALTR